MYENSADASLVAVLERRNPTLANHASHLIQQVCPLLAFAPATFPAGTDHTSSHTTTVEKIGRLFLPDELLHKLTDHELFLLVLACHFHDLGMVGTVADDETFEGREQVRRDHAVRIGEKVKREWKHLGFENRRDAEVLGEICRGHRPSKNEAGEANWENLCEREILGPGNLVRLRLLCALVYAIDELHIGADRAPERVQHWREINEENSRRHWVRHQAVNGPVIIDGRLTYQIRSQTIGFEENMRTAVLSKAFRAVKDLQKQLELDGINTKLPSLTVEWNRAELWRYLVPIVLGDLVPRSIEEIVQCVLDFYNLATVERTSLQDFCIEQGSTEEKTRASIKKTVDDEIQLGFLREIDATREKYRLCQSEKASREFLQRTEEADDLDELFVGMYRPRWKQKLNRTGWGQQYVERFVEPAIKYSYSVDLSVRPTNETLRVLLQRSPKAAELAVEYRPVTATLVKDFLLKQAVVTGTFFDLYNDPQLLLDREYRAAIREVTNQDEEASENLRLLEELALVGGLSVDQIRQIQQPSTAMQDAIEQDRRDWDGKVKISVTQTLPKDAPLTSAGLWHLLLAGQRARKEIVITAEPGLQLNVKIAPNDSQPPVPNTVSAIGIGPRQQSPVAVLRCPARFTINESTRTVRFYLYRFSDQLADKCPIVIRLPAPSPDEINPHGQFGVSIRWHLVSVRDLRKFVRVNQQTQNKRLNVEFVFAETEQVLARADHTEGPCGPIVNPDVWDAKSLKALTGVDSSAPAPLFVAQDTLRRVGDSDSAERALFWKDLQEMPISRKNLYSVYLLQFANSFGNVVDEEYLTEHEGFLWTAPTINADGVTQDKFNCMWEEGNEAITIGAFFEPDVYELANELRKWSGDMQAEFPLRFTSENFTTPLTRSRVDLVFLPKMDRVWHQFRTIVFRLRPVSRVEAYRCESDYWKSVGDKRRAELADEICGRIAAQEPQVIEQTSHS